MVDITELCEGNIEVELSVAVEVEDNNKPACVAAVVYHYYV